MRRIWVIVCLLLTLIPPAEAINWRLIHRDRKEANFVDVDSIQKIGPYTYCWAKVTRFRERHSRGYVEKRSESLNYYVYDCKNRQLSLYQRLILDKQHKTKMVLDLEKRIVFYKPTPDHITQRSLQFVCQQPSPKANQKQ